jgi:nucleotide-binding universal stress UspA family protein
MYNLKKIMISLDLSAMDADLVGYVFTFARMARAEKVLLLHVSPKGKPNAPSDQDADSAVPYKKKVMQHMKAVARPYRSASDPFMVRFQVKYGDPLTEILSGSKRKDIDLIVVGRKNIAEGSGAFSRKLAMRAICSVLILPPNPVPRFQKVFIPIDFSEISLVAVQRVVDLAYKANIPGTEVVCAHIFTLPNGYLSSGKTAEEFTEIMRENAAKRYAIFNKQLENTQAVHMEPLYQLDTRNNTAKVIVNLALLEKADIIVLGSRGRGNLTAAFLGSNTEKVLLNNLSIPTLVVKRKEHQLGFFDALLKI